MESTTEELAALLADLESDRVERTISFADREKQAIAICAFANDMPHHRAPGYLFVGADDKTGKPSGVAVTDRNLQNLAAIRSDGNIQPLPRMNVDRLRLPNGEVAVVEVFPSEQPPVSYDGRVWIRVGPRRALATVAEEHALAERRVASALTWDAQPSPAAALRDLALELFLVGYRQYAVSPEVLAENQRSVETQLAALRFLDPRSGRPTNAAILLFGKTPLDWVPGAYIQYVQYGGAAQSSEVLRERRYSGDLLSVLREVDSLAEELSDQRPVQGERLADLTVASYPARALHELFMNAVIHRNYDGSTTPITINHFADRIEILNPGGLFGDLTPDLFPRATSYRNPVLGEAAKTLGFVNRFGRGIAIVQAELARNGSPEATFELQRNFFLATVRRR